jgi:hypothetical protein
MTPVAIAAKIYNDPYYDGFIAKNKKFISSIVCTEKFTSVSLSFRSWEDGKQPAYNVSLSLLENGEGVLQYCNPNDSGDNITINLRVLGEMVSKYEKSKFVTVAD